MSQKGIKRKGLCLKRKIEIIEAVESQPTKNKATIAYELGIPPSTLGTIYSAKKKYQKQYHDSGDADSHTVNRTLRFTHHGETDRDLYEWFSDER